ncbi:hypothetical protein EZV62_020587 [Acer yangbiense]|uniref:Uncharacterized protein n=1 Tax=Acer yangbiense TaxID=1000413 RepID=A0A5C7HEI1_9ROSI|nr:hypothetical protein EZV62_020587 [Acer yangbiense]
MRTLSKGTLFAPDLLVEILSFADLLGPITLGSYASGAAGNVENLSVDIVSDGETTNYHLLGPQTEMQTTSSLNKLHAGRDSADVTIPEVEAANNGVPKGGKNISAGFSSADKSKVLRSPSTGIAGIAAHVIEQEVEI